MSLLQLHNLFHYEAPEDGGGTPSPVPGTETEVTPAVEPGTPAGAESTDTGEAPGPVPYSRFKEVNDTRRTLEQRLAPFAELEQLGYSPEDLRRLAEWETEYAQDPAGWALRNALEQENNSAEVKAAIEAAIAVKDGGSAEQPPASATSKPADESTDEVPSWAKPIVERHMAEERERETSARAEVFDGITTAWKELDEKDGVKTPSDAALATWIYAAAASYDQPVDILRAARENWLAERQAILQEAVTPAREGDTIPRPVPGSGDGAAVVRVPERPRTLDQARKLAEEAEGRGTLVPDWTV